MTTQMHEKIVIEGKEYLLESTPLEEYFKIHPERRPSFTSFNMGCMRGYIASWEVRGEKLYLTGMKMINETNDSFESIFPDGDNGVFAEWMTGKLLCSPPKLIRKDNLEFSVEDSLAKIIKVENGVISKSYPVQ